MQTQEEATHFKERGRGGIRTGGQHTDNIEGMFIITWLDAKLSSSTYYDKKTTCIFLDHLRWNLPIGFGGRAFFLNHGACFSFFKQMCIGRNIWV